MNLLAKNKLRYLNLALLLFDIFMFYLVYVCPAPTGPLLPLEGSTFREEVLGEDVSESPPAASPSAPSPTVPAPAPTPVTASARESLVEVEETPPATDSPSDSGTSDDASDPASMSNSSAAPPPPSPPPSPSLEPPSATTTAETVSQSLTNHEKTLSLYELFSREVQSVFDFASWEKAVAEAGLEVDAYQLVGETVVNGDWAEQEVELTTVDGNVHRYLLVLVKEDDEWRLFGTIEKD